MDTSAQASPIETFTAEDGAQLATKRKGDSGGSPVILIHGLAATAECWDIPRMRGEGYSYRSLADVLGEAGFDVWLLNLRGHGRPGFFSEAPHGQTDWTVDHFVTADLPAAIAHVTERTQKRPFVLGASMGAMSIAGYLGGAICDDTRPEKLKVRHGADAGGARNAGIAGAVFVEFPAALRWPNRLYDEAGRLQLGRLLTEVWRFDTGRNYSFELLSRSAWLEAVVAAYGSVPLERLRRDPDASRPFWLEHVAPAQRAVMRAMLKLATKVAGYSNHEPDVLIQGRRAALAGMKAGVLSQLGRCVRAGSFVSADGKYDYTAYYPRVSAPALVVVGGRDRIANPDVTREVFYDRLPVRDRTWRLFPEMSHSEFEAAPIATRDVYPVIRDWLRQRDKSAD